MSPDGAMAREVALEITAKCTPMVASQCAIAYALLDVAAAIRERPTSPSPEKPA